MIMLYKIIRSVLIKNSSCSTNCTDCNNDHCMFLILTQRTHFCIRAIVYDWLMLSDLPLRPDSHPDVSDIQKWPVYSLYRHTRPFYPYRRMLKAATANAEAKQERAVSSLYKKIRYISHKQLRSVLSEDQMYTELT